MADIDLSTLTVDDWRSSITRALKAHDVKAVAALVRAMAAYHPREAEEIRQTLMLGTTLAQLATEGGA